MMMSRLMLVLVHIDINMDKLTIYSGHDESNLHGIGSTGEVSVNLFRLVLIQGDESIQDVITSSLVVGTA